MIRTEIYIEDNLIDLLPSDSDNENITMVPDE